MESGQVTQLDPVEFRKVLGRFATGVTVVTTEHEGAPHGMTANAFTSVSLHPPLVLVAVDHRAHMHELLPKTGKYGINILGEDQKLLSQHFAGRPQEDAQIEFEWQQGVPLLRGSVAHLVCRIVDPHVAGDHTLYIGQVEHIDYMEHQPPLLFYSGQYRALDVQIRDHEFWWW